MHTNVTEPDAVLDRAKRLRPWLVFLDIRLPGMSGWATPEHRRRSREAEFDAHVEKPVDLELLRSILTHIE